MYDSNKNNDFEIFPCQWVLSSVLGNSQVAIRMEWEMPEGQMKGLK